MVQLDPEKLKLFRHRTFRNDSSSRLRNRDDAVRFVNERGFIFFWPIKGMILPSLWVAAAGDRPVADEHDDPGHITWGWKDETLGTGLWYYGRVLARKNCMISLDILPCFYALSPNYGEPETDYLDDYQKGIMPLEAKNVYEALLKEGPLDSIALRRAAHLTGTGTDSRLNKALEVLQTSFRLIPTGTSKNGPWHYAYIYDLFHRHFSDQINQSRTISETEARKRLILIYLNSVGACTQKDLNKLFHWEPVNLIKGLENLVSTHQICENVTVGTDKQTCFCLPELF
jgi:hypothetical protein